jgi:hypothetical protein
MQSSGTGTQPASEATMPLEEEDEDDYNSGSELEDEGY